MYVASALERLKQKDHKFETSLSYVRRAISKTAANVKSLVPELQKLKSTSYRKMTHIHGCLTPNLIS